MDDGRLCRDSIALLTKSSRAKKKTILAEGSKVICYTACHHAETVFRDHIYVTNILQEGSTVTSLIKTLYQYSLSETKLIFIH